MPKIVLISDGESSYQMVEQGLRLYGYELVTTDRGDDGLLLALTESPDLILLDIDTPELDGWQIIKNLKQSKITWLIPVIAIASRTIDGPLLIQAGFDGYDRKPLSLKHLLNRIEALLGSSSDSEPAIKPSSSEPSLPAQPRQPKQVPFAPVVHIEDNPADSQKMAQIIQQAGYSYVNLSDPLQVLPELLELKPQLIFLDLVMPMANGYEVCAQIRRISTFKDIPIMIVTNNNSIIDRLRSKLVGAYGFLHKPIREERVLKILKKYAYKPSRELVRQ